MKASASFIYGDTQVKYMCEMRQPKIAREACNTGETVWKFGVSYTCTLQGYLCCGARTT